MLISWSRNLLVAEESMSDETKMMTKFFNASSGSHYLGMFMFFSERMIEFSLADGSKSNYTKRFLMNFGKLSALPNKK